MASDPPERDGELFRLFRGLRERIFRGPSDLATRVMSGVEAQLKAGPEESLAGSMLVQLTNLFTSWLEPEAPGASGRPRDEDAPPAAADDAEPGSRGNDE
jgi:hypothetical protein